MGGINHQPTKSMFVFSTLLSQYFSGAIEKLMRANFELEHALLAELDKAPPERVAFLIKQAQLEYNFSIEFMAETLQAIDLLVERMQELNYADTSRRTVTDLDHLERILVAEGLIPSHETSWSTVSHIRRTEAFYGISRLFYQQFQDIVDEMKQLVPVFDEIQEYAARGMLTSAVDENRVPFRQQFFRILTKVIETLVMFVHSAAMSTEMYYRESGYGSLLSGYAMSDARYEKMIA